ncbi:TIGR01777 family oxidoreductase [Candidatus Uabimicrobium sp. HlEnr_7]|uniref:TIGR01777 family oxidoreductase n=1 Tax=Candidatus Uabimicrobium helgolandensis TaxID=3095367 RepID=UPI0035572FE4
MKILLTGSNGFVGSFLRQHFNNKGYQVRRLVRSKPQDEDQFSWSPSEQKLDEKALEGIDVVIHLAGENILGIWTQKKKNAIMESRRQGTKLIAQKMSEMEKPPKLLISASAIGFYGDNGDRFVDETDKKGNGFLVDVCDEWEKATSVAKEKDIRITNLRIGIVMGTSGGPLQKMLLPFKLGLGGRLGNGKQYVSWISINDIVGIIEHIIDNKNVSGPINACAPNPVTNQEMTKTLGKVLSRPTIFPVPRFVFKTLARQMSDEMLFSSTRAKPKKIMDSGYVFQHNFLQDALQDLLKK